MTQHDPVGTGANGDQAGRPGRRLLDVAQLKVTFEDGPRPALAVRGVDFGIDVGEAVGIVGESGSGKSVSALSLLRLVPSPPAASSGRAVLNGLELLSSDDRQLRKVRGGAIAMIFQDPLSSLNPVMTIGDQVAESMTIHRGIRGKAARVRAIELLDLVGISEAPRRVRQYPHEFSGGMRQRVMIAAALSGDPALLIADEPTTALDVTIQAQILDLLQDLRARLGMAILLITHDLGVAASFVDRMYVMYSGRIVEDGPTASLMEAPRHPYTLGLLASSPRIEQERTASLIPIPGSPPDVRSDPRGCAFAPRCSYAFDRCFVERPPLLQCGEDRRSACWLAPEGLPGA
jgi:oligopeptide/dipeptide ABC transporter ATP-binding protein